LGLNGGRQPSQIKGKKGENKIFRFEKEEELGPVRIRIKFGGICIRP
jgi:hypothetical protein